MKTIRLIFCVLTVLFFFLLGIGIADKEYLSQSVVGICILSDDQEFIQQFRELIEKTSWANATELYREIEHSDLSLELKREKMYFCDEIAVMGHFPDSVYDTIIIDARGNDQTVYLKQIDPVSHRFGKMQLPIKASVQRYYIAFLSALGKAERFTMGYLGFL